MSLPVIRCSNLDRTLLCPGSRTLVPLVRELARDDGDEGTFIHHAVAKRLIDELGAAPPDGGLKPASIPDNYKLPKGSEWIVEWCVRHVRDNVPSDWSLMVELPMAYEFENWVLSGHHDVLAMSPDGTQTLGIDWKTVHVATDPAESNEQVGGYLTLQRRAWPELESAEFHIVQPRVMDENLQRVSKVKPSGGELDGLVASLDKRVNTALADNMTVSTGRTQCRWCPAKLQCPAMQAEIKLMKSTLTPQLLALITKEPNDTLLGDLIISGRTIQHALEDARKLLDERLDKQGYVDAGSGTRITRKTTRGSYDVPDPHAFYEALKTVLPEEKNRVEGMSFSMTRIKDEIAKVMDIPKSSKNQPVTAETIFDGALRPLVTQGVKHTLIFS